MADSLALNKRQALNGSCYLKFAGIKSHHALDFGTLKTVHNWYNIARRVIRLFLFFVLHLLMQTIPTIAILFWLVLFN